MKPLESFTTERLKATSWQADLADPDRRRALEAGLAAILSPAVLAHLPPPLHLSPTAPDISGWIDARAAESRVLRIDDRSEPTLLGLLILAELRKHDGSPSLHVGYLLAETAWGRGLGSELVSGLVIAASSLAPVTLVAGVDRANPASARVLEKAGFTNDPARGTVDTAIYRLVLA
ncbi:GNAT family N-acetyltransferase [Tropicimonas sp. IMCC6043]|uniref:GNAT family N-acetyltransferase n=1 Tax=Tropicimonas sp. IMCC6043 TaxID=2510645 RepID=UPI0013EE34A0|nr:GNAT family N-acetyltransferase [Tropicimonas sp. IMCC6043]